MMNCPDFFKTKIAKRSVLPPLFFFVMLFFTAFAGQALSADPLTEGSIVYRDISGVYTSGIECNGSAGAQDGICGAWWGPAAAWAGCPDAVSSSTTVNIEFKSSNLADLDGNSTAPLVQTYTVTVDVSGAQLFGCMQFGSNERTQYQVNNFTISYSGDLNVEFQRIIVDSQISFVAVSGSVSAAIPLVSALPAGNVSQDLMGLSISGTCKPDATGCDISLSYGWKYSGSDGNTIGRYKEDVCNAANEGSVGDSPLMCLDVNRPDLGWTGGRSLHTGGGLPFYVGGPSQTLDFTPPPEPEDASSAGALQSATDGDPVNTFSGELFNNFKPDLDLGGPMPLVFQRYYASHLRRSYIVGDLGSNWRHNFDARLYISGNTAKYVGSKGRVTDFLKDINSGVWEQLTNNDTPYQLLTPAGQNAVLYDPLYKKIYTFDFTSGNTVMGKLVTVEDGKGNVHTVAYDLANGHIQSISDGLGRTLTFTYNTDAIPKIVIVSDGVRSVNYDYADPVDTEYLTTFTDAQGGSTTYNYADTSAVADHALMLSTIMPRQNIPYTQTYNAEGQVATQTDSDGNTFSFAYAGTYTTLTDPLGNTRVHTHTAAGEFSKRQDQNGLSFSMGSDSTGRRNSITDRLGNVTSYGYNAGNGNMASITTAEGNTSTFSYTPRIVQNVYLYDLTGITHADGSTETMAYDAAGNMTSHTDQAGNAETFTYDDYGQPLTVTNKLGGVTTNTYNSDETLATTTDPAGNATALSYDGSKRLNQIAHADDAGRSYSYDNENRLLTATDENGNTVTMGYDANGNLSTVSDPLSNATTYAYDGNDRLLSVTDPSGNSVSRTYNELGNPATITDANGNTTTNGYDALGRLISIIDPEGNDWTFSYNAEAILAETKDPLLNATTFTSDAMGRITSTTSPLGYTNSVDYDEMGRVVSTTDALNNTTAIARDERGLVSEVSLPNGAAASYARNALGQKTKVTDPNANDWLRDYDVSGRLTEVTDPLTRTQAITYDNRNRMETVTYPGGLGSVTMSYDAAGNLTGHEFSDGTTTSYSYDANNRLTEATGISRAYDVNGRLSNTNGIEVTRDEGGRIATITLATGKAITYSYDANNRVTSVTDWAGGATSFSYDAAGRLTGVTRPNAANATYDYDNDSRLVAINDDSYSISLTRDANGQIVSATRNLPQAASAAGLSSSSNSFDAAHQISGATYDAVGRLTGNGADSYSWNLASLLTSYTVDGTTVSAAYDAESRRLSRTAGGATRSYVWNDALGLPSVSIEKEDGADLRYYVHTPGGRLLYCIDAASGKRSFYHHDEMGNTTFVTDDDGSVIASYAYSPFGQITASAGGLDNPFTWQGQYGVMDEGNGLYSMRARYYDGRTGRFISRDPVKSTSPKKVNPYQYALNNPLKFVDVDGRDSYDAANVMSLQEMGIIGEPVDSVVGELAELIPWDVALDPSYGFDNRVRSPCEMIEEIPYSLEFYELYTCPSHPAYIDPTPKVKIRSPFWSPEDGPRFVTGNDFLMFFGQIFVNEDPSGHIEANELHAPQTDFKFQDPIEEIKKVLSLDNEGPDVFEPVAPELAPIVVIA